MTNKARGLIQLIAESGFSHQAKDEYRIHWYSIAHREQKSITIDNVLLEFRPCLDRKEPARYLWISPQRFLDNFRLEAKEAGLADEKPGVDAKSTDQVKDSVELLAEGRKAELWIADGAISEEICRLTVHLSGTSDDPLVRFVAGRLYFQMRSDPQKMHIVEDAALTKFLQSLSERTGASGAITGADLDMLELEGKIRRTQQGGYEFIEKRW
jgi:hypothetical protein